MVKHALGKGESEGSIPSPGSIPLYTFNKCDTIRFMAKKGAREIVAMVCEACKSQNYVTERNKINMEGKLTIKKFCKRCKKQTLHKETSKLK